MICRPFEIVVVPFPFTDKSAAKKRTALALSPEEFNRQGHAVLAMITTKSHAPWPGDCPIEDFQGAGLGLPCIIRLKLVFDYPSRCRLKPTPGVRSPDFRRGAKFKCRCPGPFGHLASAWLPTASASAGWFQSLPSNRSRHLPRPEKT